jgi:hypothetical protein
MISQSYVKKIMVIRTGKCGTTSANVLQLKTVQCLDKGGRAESHKHTYALEEWYRETRHHNPENDDRQLRRKNFKS